MSDIDLNQGVDVHILEGMPVKIFNVPKTLADCFLWSDLVGTDVAEEAFEEAIAYKKCTIQSFSVLLWQFKCSSALLVYPCASRKRVNIKTE